MRAVACSLVQNHVVFAKKKRNMKYVTLFKVDQQNLHPFIIVAIIWANILSKMTPLKAL